MTARGVINRETKTKRPREIEKEKKKEEKKTRDREVKINKEIISHSSTQMSQGSSPP